MTNIDRRDAVLWMIGGVGGAALIFHWLGRFAKFWRERPVVIRNDHGHLEVRRDLRRQGRNR